MSPINQPRRFVPKTLETNMSLSDLYLLSPLLIMATAPVLIMLVIAFYRNHTLTAALSGLSLAAAFLAIFPLAGEAPRPVTALLVVDGFGLFYMGLIFVAGMAVTILAHGYLEEQSGNQEEFYVLLLLACLGAAVLVSSTHFASFFLGLETLSVSLYALIAYKRWTASGIEAGIKYLILTAASDAFLLFGMALIYAQLGTMDFKGLQVLRTAAPQLLLLAGVGLLTVGIGFKLALAPFHMWTPDVYQGAPAPVTAFLATVSKGAVFALLFRYFSQAEIQVNSAVFLVFSAVSVLSMFAGNILALMQTNVKRILAYSSIAHLGYLLVAFLAAGTMASTAVAFYLVAYFVTTLGAFGVVTVLSSGETEAEALDEYRGLFWRRPWLAGFFSVMLLSLAGIPLTAGFVGKFYVMAAGVGSALWFLVAALVINSVIGLFYYLRIIAAMYIQPAGQIQAAVEGPRLPVAAGLVFAALAALLLWLGVYPGPFIGLIQAALSGS